MEISSEKSNIMLKERDLMKRSPSSAYDSLGLTSTVMMKLNTVSPTKNFKVYKPLVMSIL